MIKDEIVEITLTSNTVEWYTEKGYEVPSKTRVKMEVSSLDLPPSSSSHITRICDSCEEEHFMKRVKYTPVCRKCNSGKMAKDRADESLTTCPDCGVKISYQSSRCKSCYGKANSGENNPMYGKKLSDNHPLVKRNKAVSENPELHHNWKGGKGGRSGKQIKWSKEVKDIFNNECDCCGYRRELALEAHHYNSSERSQENFDLDNGVALCSNCHKEFHKTYGYGSNTEKQYLDFKGEYNG